jgi:nucleotide-binding universal stress UspA family protein
MFKHILLPVDSWSASQPIVQKCVKLARENGARLTALHVIPQFHVLAYQPEMLVDTPDLYRRDSEAQARALLAKIETEAREFGVPCDAMFVWGDHPYEEIVRLAADKECDLVCMASHGRRGVKGLLLGSETQKVLTHCQVPVLVYR